MSCALFSPITIKNITLKNRLVMSPMCMYSATNKEGFLEDFHYTHYISRAIGQIGLIMVEATAVTKQGRISEKDLGIWRDEQIAPLKRLVDGIHQYEAKTAIQLAHAGRKAKVEGDILAPSAIPFDEHAKTPNEMSEADIRETIFAFKEGARRAKEAGFDIIEIHGAHGYLINEFLSPLTNKREDSYGGTKENRYRFLHDVIIAVKEVWDGPLFVRISACDYHEEGLTPTDYIEYAKWMKEDGVDLVDVSSGAVVPASIDVYPGYQVPFSETIRHNSGMLTGAVGMITNGLQAEEIVKNGRADLIFIGRELLRNPYFAYEAAKQLKTEINAPVQYERGWVM